eukprot:gnl/TRDRNA2_/TRDRNA2_125153_c0_seq1.p1 gnl/TRDRNA2_/TRDRNA2_125153_c0~~gnl/TRDRNA2_/TRDRNA2_125153_c0_seq1.p1  ORF type:complete len:344 (-),score=38.07 gnl/TRDRNA2_/TRDRNA2_125153_c0_seq1:175-1206(-)
MCGFLAIVLFAFVVRVHARDKLVFRLADRLFGRLPKAWELETQDLEKTVLAKGIRRRKVKRRRPQPSITSMSSGRVSHEIVSEALLMPEAPAYHRSILSSESSTGNMRLMSGDPVVQIEGAPNNAVRIFAGIDVVAPMQSVWDVLTDYENLHKVVPSLIRNKVLKRFSSGGARIAQVGAARVLPGVSFKAKMVVDVNVFFENSHPPLCKMDSKMPLTRGVFPRPYALTSLPHRDITMANIAEMPGDFDHYQGVWRLQPLPGCAPEGFEASRLTYAVEVKPKGWLPVQLIQGRIASDLKTNLKAIRNHVQANVASERVQMANISMVRMADFLVHADWAIRRVGL